MGIMVGSKSDHSERDLEEFWLEIAESSYKIIPDIYLIDYDIHSQRYMPRQISSASANARNIWCSKNVCSKMVVATACWSKSIGR